MELPLLHQDAATGLLTAQSVLELHTLTAAAASRRDFRTAAHLQTMLDVLGGGLWRLACRDGPRVQVRFDKRD